MKNGGNTLVNKLFEGKLSTKEKAAVKPDRHTELDQRSKYIYDKYQHHKWLDQKLVEQGIEKPTARPSAGEFDDFFALRTKDAASDAWHEDGENDFDVFSDQKQRVSKTLNGSSQNARSAFPDPFEPQVPNKVNGSSKKKPNSNRDMLNSIRDIEKDDDNHNLSPQKVVQSFRRKKDGNTSTEWRAVGVDDRQRSGSSGNPDRGKKSVSADASSKPQKRGVTRNSSEDSNEQRVSSSQKPASKRDLRRSGGKSPTSSERSVASNASKSRCIGRTKSMDSGSDEHSQQHRRRRSKSAKRSVRRAYSSDEASFVADGNSSVLSFDGNSSQRSSYSAAKRPPRLPRGGGTNGIVEEEEASRASTRRSRRDDSSGRPRSSKSVTSSRSKSRTRRPKPSSTPANGNAITLTRIQTVRDRSPRTGHS